MAVVREFVLRDDYLVRVHAIAMLVEQVFDLTQRQGEADIHHNSKADSLGRSLEITEWIA